MKRLFLLAWLLFAVNAYGQTGYLSRPDCDSLTSPIDDQTVCLQTTTADGRTAGHIYIRRNGAWEDVDSGGAGAGTVTSVGAVGTANQITVTGSSPITTSGSWTFSIPTNPTLPGTTTGTFSGSLTGNASTATALSANPSNCSPGQAARGITAAGVGEDCFDVSTQTEMDAHTAATGTGAHSATSANTASQIVTRDASGNFSAGTISANLTGAVTGNASTSTALAANGANCSTGSGAGGVDASGAAENCTNYMEEPAGSGIVARSAANTAVNRTITGTAGQITVSNGDGVAGNPTLSLDADVALKSGIQAGGYVYCADAGANDTYTCTITPTLTAYTAGMLVVFVPNTTNTGAATLNVDTLGAKAIKTYTGGDPGDGELTADRWYTLLYDGTDFKMHQDIQDAGGAGITSLGGQTGSTQTFGNDTNVTIVSSGDNHAITWAGTLAKGRQNAQTAYYDDATPTFTNPIIGNLTGNATGVTGLTASRALISDGVGALDESAVTSTELGHVAGVTSSIQTQIDNHTASTSAHSATATNTASRIVLRDGSGNFAAGTITGNLTGTASNATLATTATALAANGTNCSPGEVPRGVDASGNAESCATPTIAADSVTLGTSTTGNYVSSATANQGLLLTGTEGASLGLIDCAANQVLKRNAGDTAWECAADQTGGTPTAATTTFTPAGNLAADDVQEALEELDSEKAGLATANTFEGVNAFEGQTTFDLTIGTATSAGAFGATACTADGFHGIDTTNDLPYFCGDGAGSAPIGFDTLGDTLSELNNGVNSVVTTGADTIRVAGIHGVFPIEAFTKSAAFTNQPANDGVEIGSDNAGDVQVCTVYGTTFGGNERQVVSEAITLTGVTFVSSVKTNWNNILAVRCASVAVGTITLREASGNATITTLAPAATTAAHVGLLVNSFALDPVAVANLPVTPATGTFAIVSDAASSASCEVAGGSTKIVCYWDGSNWIVVGGASDHGALSGLTDDDHSTVYVKYESSAGTPAAGSCDRAGQIQFDTTNSLLFGCFSVGGNPVDISDMTLTYVQVCGDSGCVTANASDDVLTQSGGVGLTNTCATDACTMEIDAGGVTVAKVADPLKTKSITFRIGSDSGAVLVDTQDEATVWRNNIAAMTITEVICESDAGTPSINLQRDDGSAANILSSNLSCSTSGATGSIAAAEDNLAVGDKIDFVMVAAGGVAKRVTISIKATLD